MRDNKLSIKEKLKKVKKICEEECPVLYADKGINVIYDHYSPEVYTVYLRENPDTPNRVTHESTKHIAERIKNEVSERMHLGLLVARPELFAWYTGETDEDEEEF